MIAALHVVSVILLILIGTWLGIAGLVYFMDWLWSPEP